MNSERIQAIYRDEFGVEAVTLQWDGCLVFRTVIRECVCEIDSDFDGISIIKGTLSGDTFPFHFNEGCIWEFSLTLTFPLRFNPEAEHPMGQLVIQSRKFGDSKKQPWELFFQVSVNGSTLLELGAGWRLVEGLGLVFEKLPDDFKPRCCLFCRHVREDFDTGDGWLCQKNRICVHELHWCDQFQPRIPDTGYRG